MVGSHDDGYAAHKAQVDVLNRRTQSIRELNDAFRQGRGSGRLGITAGVQALGPERFTMILA